ASIKNNPEFLIHPLMQITKIKADIVSFDGMDLPGHTGWRIIFTPGHSPNCISLYNEETKSLFSGDALITIDGRISRSIVVWDGAAYDRTINRLKSLKIDNLYPGHGDPVHGRNLLDSM
ncbi:MAG: MBL fold metallo-hydrolase, partial [Spirochaetes bacterium]|nr:MBL fold metallo-hydrolase [Spirochaetota bacterium]